MELNFSRKLQCCMLSQSRQVLQNVNLEIHDYFHAKDKKKLQLLNISIYYKIMAGTLSRQDEAYPAF